jgi:hypothetical protein
MSDLQIIHVSLALRQTKEGKWACYFTFNGERREFVRQEMANAVMAATEFLERDAPIGLMRIGPKLR